MYGSGADSRIAVRKFQAPAQLDAQWPHGQVLLAAINVGIRCPLGHQIQEFALPPIEIAQRRGD